MAKKSKQPGVPGRNDDLINVNSGENTFADGKPGDDIITDASGGDDVINGGSGSDTVIYNHSGNVGGANHYKAARAVIHCNWISRPRNGWRSILGFRMI